MMSHQEIFDQAVGGVIRQGRPAVLQLGSCTYRTPDGLKCAVGWLIPDEKYCAGMDGWSINRLMAHIGIDSSDRTKQLLNCLMNAHDDAAIVDPDGSFVETFKRYARGVAERFDLSAAAAA